MELASALQRVNPILRKSEIGKVSSRILMVSLLLDLRMMAEAGLGEPGQLPWGPIASNKNRARAKRNRGNPQPAGGNSGTEAVQNRTGRWCTLPILQRDPCAIDCNTRADGLSMGCCCCKEVRVRKDEPCPLHGVLLCALENALGLHGGQENIPLARFSCCLRRHTFIEGPGAESPTLKTVFR